MEKLRLREDILLQVTVIQSKWMPQKKGKRWRTQASATPKNPAAVQTEQRLTPPPGNHRAEYWPQEVTVLRVEDQKEGWTVP